MIKLPADGGGLLTTLRPAWAVVDLDALEHNLAYLRRQIEPAGLLAVIKADAYGHGAPIVARTLERESPHRFWWSGPVSQGSWVCISATT